MCFVQVFQVTSYICSKSIIAPMIHDRESDKIGGERKKELCFAHSLYLYYVVFCTLAYVAFVICTHVAFVSF